ncbi:MAG: hypothetical protein IH591_01775, partial [Bacteroidales bacterium]|nr:hypothetical protein [Bacteroidales bacterium]
MKTIKKLGLSLMGIILILFLAGLMAPNSWEIDKVQDFFISYDPLKQWDITFKSGDMPVIAPAAATSFGSGHFGAWETDEYGSPVYRYTCNQLVDPKAVRRVNPDWVSPTNHQFQIGNDRLVGVASNFGYVQVRQDEGSPKFLNDFDPKRGIYGGGLGFLSDGTNSFSTIFPGNAETFDRLYGTGYFRKKVSAHGYSADQVIFAPYGDDPLVISQVTITNNNPEEATIKWTEYWDNHTHQFSWGAIISSYFSGGKFTPPEARRQFARKFSHETEKIDNYGLIDRTKFSGKLTPISLVKLPVAESKVEDEDLPATFLICLDGEASGMTTNSTSFFGEGGAGSPDGINSDLNSMSEGEESGDALMIERTLKLKPGESKTLYFAYGYQDQGVDIDKVLSKYKSNYQDQLVNTVNAWKQNRISFTVEGETWVDRELAWHNYYLRGAMTHDAFFDNKMLSQGHVYQYILGFQGAARDPMQHALPFIYTDPHIAKEIIRYSCKEVMDDGSIPYGIVGSGVVMPSAFLPSDTEIWLMWLVAEYVLANRDKEFLNEKIKTYPIYKEGIPERTIKEVMDICFDHLINTTGNGKHGLLRLSNGDWNDGAVMGFVPKDQEESVRLNGESVLNAAFASYVLELYGRFLDYIGDEEMAEKSKTFAEGQKKAVREQWCGKWYLREWLNDSLGWIGEEVLWLEPQPWAIIGGASTVEQTEILVNSLNKYVRDPSPIGALLMSEPLTALPTRPGELMNAGVWPSINGTLIWALANVDKELGWEEWKKNSLAYHAEAYPEIWFGIWSGPDTYNSVLAKYPGSTFVSPDNDEDQMLLKSVSWTDFPVFNLHPHAWPLYDVPKLFGLEFSTEGFAINPSFPKDYNFDSPLVSLKKKDKILSGKYQPMTAGDWKIVLKGVDASHYRRLKVNGKKATLSKNDAGEVIISGSSKPGSPMV